MRGPPVPEKILGCLYIDFILTFLKEPYAENLAKIVSKLSILEPI